MGPGTVLVEDRGTIWDCVASMAGKRRMSMQSICVFGASRGAGANVVRLACSQGSDVRAITPNPAAAKVPDGANAMHGDVYDGQFCEHLAVMAYASNGRQMSSEPLT